MPSSVDHDKVKRIVERCKTDTVLWQSTQTKLGSNLLAKLEEASGK